MTIMKTTVYWILVFHSMLIVWIAHAGHRQASDRGTIADLQEIVNNRRTIFKLLHRSWMTDELIRSKRDEEVEEEEEEEEAVPTRHARHRKRRRCRNRSICLRGPSATRLILLRGNDTTSLDQTSKETKKDRDLNNAVLETEEESRDRLGVNDREQESYNETRGEDYEVSDTGEEKGRIDSREGSFVVAERNTSFDDSLSDSESIDSYEERPISSETWFKGSELPSRRKNRSKKDNSEESRDYIDEGRSSSIYSAIGDQVAIHESLSVLLSKLFQSLRNASATDGQDIFKELNFVNVTNEDPCQKWLNSKDKLEQVFLGGLASLPACPCQYPSNIFYDDKIWDKRRERYFRWRDVSGDSQRLDVYKPGATYCVRSLLTQGSGSAAAQHCCYDRQRKLLTRGSGAGTPNFVSPEISPLLHERIDVLPWRLCKGDFSRYNGVRPPNNDNDCEPNPDDEEYQQQIDNTKYY